jgi:branched-chain amino acid transport system ATP-binding protein
VTHAVLALNELHVAYGEVEVLRGVSLRVETGEVVALLGNNGAGKSTTLRTISGLLRPRGGSVWLDGEMLAGVSPHAITARGVAHVPEGRRVFSRLTVHDNLILGAYTRRGRELAADLERAMDLFPRLRERRDQVAGTLSGGEQQMLAIARALMLRPRLLLLDEPSMGLAPIVVEQIFETIRTIHQGGTTVLLVEQNAFMALEVASRAYVMEGGIVVLEGRADALRADERVRKAYLGED